MQRSSPLLLAAALLLTIVVGSAVSQTQPKTPARPAKPATKSAPAAQVHDDGQRVFEQNCSRCHTTPDGFSPRISGTVARHMRVRASLSRDDEQALLRFLNP